MSRRPVVGISGPDRGGYASWWFAAMAVRRAGGRPLRITHSRGFDMRRLDAVIIGGGADIAPDNPELNELSAVREALRQSRMRHWYSYLMYPLIYLLRRLFSIKKARRYDSERDALEFHLLQVALQSQLPVLGICRGAQLINRHLGGSLIEDITDFYEEEPLPNSIFPVKRIHIGQDSLLRRVLATSECTINALHHQAVDALGEGVSICAREVSTNIVQGIEIASRGFVLGVQWHPEYMPLDRTQQRLFSALTEAAHTHKASRE